MAIFTRSDFDVELVDSVGSDEMICRAARVSTIGAESIDSDESAGLINFLMRNRHGTPFEHNSMTFRIKAPIFVWREFMRHRIGFSYNEQSGRYMELSPEFYIPAPSRPLIQTGKAGKYQFEPGTVELYSTVRQSLKAAYNAAWNEYRYQLDAGIAKEVARICLPVSIYSCAYVTCNARSLMSFLSLRTKSPFATFPSYPMTEIEDVARKMEYEFGVLFPLTHTAFADNGRVSP